MAARLAAVAVVRRALALLCGEEPPSEQAAADADAGADAEPAAAEVAAAAVAADEALPPPRLPRLRLVQFYSYHGRDAAAAPAAAALPPQWHVLAGRAAEAGRLTSEFDAREARRVFDLVCPGKRFHVKEEVPPPPPAAAEAEPAPAAVDSCGEAGAAPLAAAPDAAAVAAYDIEADLAALRGDADLF